MAKVQTTVEFDSKELTDIVNEKAKTALGAKAPQGSVEVKWAFNDGKPTAVVSFQENNAKVRAAG